ncbi:hypothetical protein AB1Y20_013338 [Prymnesium parvum]|uniref:Uncharacterized protein n=1 Tax=Prymnesium parvum TaxID=97485 RepID=A0AB34IMX5_PRYPA
MLRKQMKPLGFGIRTGPRPANTSARAPPSTVNLLLTEVTGARHAHAERFLRLCASAHAARFPHLAGDPTTLSFTPSTPFTPPSSPSPASAAWLGEQLRSRIVSSVSRASLRRRVPLGPRGPAPP